MTPDKLCEEYAGRVELTVRKLDDFTVLIEGDRTSLRFLAQLLEAVCDEDQDGFQIEPNGAGSVHFAASSTLGLYLHRVPCSEPMGTQ